MTVKTNEQTSRPADDDRPQVLAAGRYLQLVRRGRWEYAQRCGCHGAVVIVAVTADRELVLTEQFRIPLDRAVIELPAGLVGDEDAGDDTLSAARRELLEETGYAAASLEHLTFGPTSAGLSDEVVTLVRARGLRRVAAGGGVGEEQIVVHRVPLDDVPGWVERQTARGALVDPKVFAGLFFALRG